jgi:hypothetical protein
MAEIGRELGWDDSIENDGPEFVLLPAGDYDFEVVGFERGRFTPSETSKIPACNMAILKIKLEGAEGIAIVQHKLFLHTSTEGLLCSFFTSIGQRKHGEKLKMDWNKVVGSKGRCKVAVRPWTGKDGTEYASNDIKSFYEPEEKAAGPGFEAGKF